jgi:dephospho-CoA kinase
MPTIGLTGNFGMGKTTVLGLFKKLGAHTFNIDDFVHKILHKDTIIRKISRLLGDKVLMKTSYGTSLNKKKVASIIFSDPDKRKAIEKIIHPGVLKEIKAIKSNILKEDPDALMLFEVPLLFEAGYENHFDKTIVVHSKRQTAINRLTEKGFTKDDILKRFRSQMPIYRKKDLADFIVENNGDIKVTTGRVKKIFRELMKNG